MKKASKILTLILLVVFVFSVFSGCDLIGRNVAKYRNAEAIQIGNETITIGKLLDTYNTYYNQYYYYISAGYLDAEYLFEMALESLVRQYVQVDDYVTRHANDEAVKNSPLKGKAHNAEYLTEAEFEYAVKYIRYLIYNQFDQTVESKITAKYDLEDAKTEDTSRDFSEYDDITVNGEMPTYYAEYYYNDKFVNKDANEYFEKYYPADITFDALDVEGYVYDESSEYVQKRVDEYNDRLADSDDEENTDKLTVQEYIEMQGDVIKQFSDTIRNNYSISMQEFFNNQLDDMVAGCIANKWEQEVYADIETDPDFEQVLVGNYETLRDQYLKSLSVNNNFDSFITGLSDNDFIYNVPSDTVSGKNPQDYVFVKNVLIPFSTVQTNFLTKLANQLGTKDDDSYKLARDKLATEILAEYYYSDKYDESIEELFSSYLTENTDEDSDSKYEKVEGIFKMEGDKLVVNPDGILGQILLSNGQVDESKFGLTKDQTIIELMKRFNTDVGQHSKLYDYVVYVGEDENYKHNWVDEFVQATKDALGEDKQPGGYALGVSDYGVHIVYVTGYVSSYTFEFKFADHLKTETASYRLFKTYFESQVSLRTTEARNELLKKYIDEHKISTKEVLKVFLEENKFDFKLDAYLEELKHEL